MKLPLPSKTLAAVALPGALALAACSDPVGDAPRAQATEPAPTPAAPAEKQAQAGTTYSFTQDGSTVAFVGAKVTGKHDGGFKTFKGTIVTPDGKVESAKVDVEIDMKSVFSDAEKLTGHLMSPDFFDVEKFPTSRFVSTSIKPNGDGTSTVTGNLTLHGVTKQITFPAKVDIKGDAATATAEFGINRKDFGIVYPGMPDDLIKDEVLLKLNVTAKR